MFSFILQLKICIFLLKLTLNFNNLFPFFFSLQRKSIVAVSFIAAFLCLIIVRLTNEVTFPLILNCFGQTSVKWIPFSNGQRQPLRTHYGYINVKTQEVRPGFNSLAKWTSRFLFLQSHLMLFTTCPVWKLNKNVSEQSGNFKSLLPLKWPLKFLKFLSCLQWREQWTGLKITLDWVKTCLYKEENLSD